MSEDRNGESDRPATERAEELVDRLLQEAGHLLSVAAVNLLKGASLARELGVDLREVAGTGAGGRITVTDVERKAAAGKP